MENLNRNTTPQTKSPDKKTIHQRVEELENKADQVAKDTEKKVKESVIKFQLGLNKLKESIGISKFNFLAIVTGVNI